MEFFGLKSLNSVKTLVLVFLILFLSVVVA